MPGINKLYPIPCYICHKQVLRRKRFIDMGQRFSCSDECRRQILSLCGKKRSQQANGYKGENNPNWKGGVTKNKKSKYASDFKKRHPQKHKAHLLVSRLIKSGILVRGACDVCGALKNIHAHHDDYDKPAEVRWLCQKHHISWHKHNN